MDILDKGISYFLDRKTIPNPLLYFTRSVYKRLNGLEYKKDYEKAILIASLSENEELIRKFKNSKNFHDEWEKSKTN